MDYQKLFNHLREEHNLILLESEMQEIENIVNEKTQHQKELIDNLKGVLTLIISNPKKFHSGRWYELDVPIEEIALAESILKETNE